MAGADAPATEWAALDERDPGDVALVDAQGTWTVGELAAAARSVAAGLERTGVQPGDRVVLALPNSLEFVATYLAVRLCGAIIVNLPWQWRRELVAVVEETRARIAVLAEGTAGDPALASIADRRWRPVLDDRARTADGPVARDDQDVAWLAYTSGTTGAPKGAVHTEATLRRMPEAFIENYALGRDDRVLVAAPAGHAVGFVYGIQLALRAACPMVLMPRWDVRAAAGMVGRHRCTFVAGPAPFLLDTVELAESGEADAFAGLRWFCCGGAAVPASLLERAREALPGTRACAYYGTSECGGVTGSPPQAPVEKLLATDGAPLKGMEVALEDGELLVRGSQLARGYWGPDPAGQFRADGWFATGDDATIDGDGYVCILGRRSELIRRGGVAVAPVEIEEALATHPRVREVAVVGVDDPRLGQRVAAEVVARGEPPTLDELRAWCREAGMAKVKWPELVRPVAYLPRSAAGKVLRR